MITLKVDNVYSYILGDLSATHIRGLEEELRFRPKGYQYSPKFNLKFFACTNCNKKTVHPFCKDCGNKDCKFLYRAWDGWKKQFWSGQRKTYFPTGLISIVKDYFGENDIEYRGYDIRVRPEKNINLEYSGLIEYRDYQKKIIKSSATKGRGIIQAATGAGKTIIATGIMKEIAVSPIIFFVTSIDLLTQAKESFEEVLLQDGKPLKVGQIGGGIIDIKDVNVMTIQTAVRALGKTWNSETKYDSDDTDDKTPIAERKEEIQELIHTAKLSFADECISGDSIVITKDGPKKMKELNNYIGKDILSFSDNSVVWKKITHFFPKGKKETIKISLLNGEYIICTKDHPIMTKMGWKEAGNLNQTDQILYYVNVGVEQKSMLKKKVPVSTQNIFLDTRSKKELYQNGRKNTMMPSQNLLYANVGVGKKQICNTIHLNHTLNMVDVLNIENINMGMTKDLQIGRQFCQIQKNKPFLELYLETLLYLFQVKEVRIQDYIALMENVNLNGLYINQIFFQYLILNLKYKKVVDTEISPLFLEHVAIQKLIRYIKSFILMEEKLLQKIGSIQLETSAWLGGSVMMATATKIILNSIQKDIKKKKLKSFQTGLIKNTEKHLSIKPKKNTTLSILENKQEMLLSEKLKIIYQNVCNTNYVGIKEITKNKIEDVYDITVEGSHCFFANNILVHNCQHWRASTCQSVMNSLYGSYYRFGMSATPYRDEGDDMMIQACFGKKIATISASKLIKDKWLIKPEIKMIHVYGPKSPYKSWQKIYKDQIAENEEYNQMVAKIANAYIERGRLVLVLVNQIKHGKEIAKMINNSMFLSGASTKKKREDGIKSLRNRYISCIVSTVIFDEGIDIKPLDTVILAGQGKSKTRAMQRIGRIIRPFPNKESATAIDFMVHQKFLEDHAIERLKMYQTEHEFSIEEIDPRAIV